MPSIIIPAHNESLVIGRCLNTLIESLCEKEFEVIVVCNGCTDDTADIVSSISEKIICIETDKASKTYALNLGDEVAHFFPRLYLDADVVLPIETVMALDAVLDNGFLAASCEIKMNLDNSSWFVKAYYDVWLSLPYCRAGMIGSGVYALSKVGRARFDKFPDIIADDGYIRCLFKEKERGLTRGYYSIVKSPHNLSGLIKIKTRSRLGGYQLKAKYPVLRKNEEKNYKGAMKNLLKNIKLWPKLIVYLLVNIIARYRAHRQLRNKRIIWERDESSRG